MRGRLFRKTTLLCLPLITALTLHAQEATRTLTGSVTDRSHEPLRGAVVQLENENTHSIISFITDKRGIYSFKRIGSDTDYKVWATFRGVQSKPKALDKFNAKKEVRIDLIVALH